MTVTITNDHIQRGMKSNAKYCPIAIALSELYPHRMNKIRVTNGNVTITGVDFYSLPFTAYEFINKFDAGETVNPFSFEIEGLPNEVRIQTKEATTQI